MTKKENYFNKKDEVLACLKKHERVRDCDDLLIGKIVRRNEGKNLDNMSANELLENLEKGYYGKFESITRARRKIQEITPDLRGKMWDRRHAFQGRVIEQLTFWESEEEE